MSKPPLILTGDEAAELAEFAARFGVLHVSREWGGGTWPNFYATTLPLVEEFDRRTVAHLKFWRTRAAAERGRGSR